MDTSTMLLDRCRRHRVFARLAPSARHLIEAGQQVDIVFTDGRLEIEVAPLVLSTLDTRARASYDAIGVRYAVLARN